MYTSKAGSLYPPLTIKCVYMLKPAAGFKADNTLNVCKIYIYNDSQKLVKPPIALLIQFKRPTAKLTFSNHSNSFTKTIYTEAYMIP